MDAVPGDRLADPDRGRPGEDRPVVAEGVELPALAARIDPGGQVVEERLVVGPAGERGSSTRPSQQITVAGKPSATIC